MSSRFDEHKARLSLLLKRTWALLNRPTGATCRVWIDQNGVRATGGGRVLASVAGEPMQVLPEVLAAITGKPWLPAVQLSVTFAWPFARDYLLPWPAGLTRLQDYEAYAAHTMPLETSGSRAWQVGFSLPCLGASAHAWAVPADYYQALLVLCKQARLAVIDVHTPLSAGLAHHGAQLPENGAMVVLDGDQLHCALLVNRQVSCCFCWPFDRSRPLREVIDLACMLAGKACPEQVVVAANRPDNSALWQWIEWLGPVHEGEAP